ncbi:MAG: winged helix-turn-helix domain-containing protein, partial [Bacteroidales bacterium]|nr:winged helix-turn-helix domain-containing protein [Bacteroidales bacterium]MBN2820556.1 winged helix-turn-helix domain-containing protein [Bacteroidales bacterium]
FAFFDARIFAIFDVLLIAIFDADWTAGNKLLQTNKRVLTNYLNSISNRAQFLSNKIKFLSFQTIKGKIAHYLLQLRQKAGSDIFLLPKSQNELSEMFAVARPSLGRAIREMDAEGIIGANGKEIRILDKNRLSALLRN